MIDIKSNKISLPDAFNNLNQIASNKVYWKVQFKLFDLSVPEQRQELETIMTRGINSGEDNKKVLDVTNKERAVGQKGIVLTDSGEGQFVSVGDTSTYMVALRWFEWEVKEKNA